MAGKNLALHGAAFTHGNKTASHWLHRPADGKLHIGLLHGEITPRRPGTIPIRKEEITPPAALPIWRWDTSTKGAEPFDWRHRLAGRAYPEGRGFLGEKAFIPAIDDSGLRSAFVPFARQRYEILTVDVTDQDPRRHRGRLPFDTAQDLYVFCSPGDRRGASYGRAAVATLADRFYALELRDRTGWQRRTWGQSGGGLRGLF